MDKKNIGIVTTWFERGAAYVSKQYMEILQQEHNVFIYARSGESYAIGNPAWDLPNVYWSKKINSPFVVTVIDKKEFVRWIKRNKIEIILFNEQHWWPPLIWCKELGIKTIAYIDYYTEETLPLFNSYDLLICNTKKHFEAFKWHKGARYIPWGTDLNLFKPKSNYTEPKKDITFFHSCGMNPLRKGTDLLLKCIPLIQNDTFKVIIHTQTDLRIFFPDLHSLIDNLISSKKLEIIQETINAPGLYHLGDVYVYPSRLEGIGLTVAEAIACGLPIITPDCGPMNEFVKKGISDTVRVEKYFSRHDGYYWPQNEVDIFDLSDKMSCFIKNKQNITEIKKQSREYAVENLDWYKNAKKLLLIVNDKNEEKRDMTAKIKAFENKGIKKYNKYYLMFPVLFDKLLIKM
ncbi:glycosyltransferase family 4 protein [Chryseobacterium echinoideorum]|uniref:glycosyltransferase family 4 protein n=1 Tax=Chryseobacterium echinoideorum TaxID=1549648 RepID=UPI001186CEB4|nr:glycosyltransferase family 4 protein [Chryseobacterium echinoideorum]